MKVGAAFSDHIKTGKMHKRQYDFDSPRSSRPLLLLLFLLLFPLVLLLRLVNIQLVYGNYYRTLADSNRTKTIILYPQRGIIFDRRGVPLVYNNPNFEKVEGSESEEISREKAIEILAKRQTNLAIEARRYYPLKEVTAHILGYVGNPSKEELSLPQNSNYLPQDMIGKSGIEFEYESKLYGIKGKELVEVDALGEKIRTLGVTDPIAGADITLTIDSRLQYAAFNALPNDKRGVVIVSTPKGEVLTMVSKPSYDPNLFTLGETYVSTNSAYKTVSSILNDVQDQPLMNRAISGSYPPGSTFKLVTAAAGLEKKIIDKNYRVEDTGILRVGTFSFGNWFFLEQGKKDGMVDVVKGISRSNDIFFYKLAEKIGVDRLSDTAKQFGVGRNIGIDLPGEVNGVLPTKEWKKKIIKEPWYLGDTYHYGIGQGYVLTTPLQVNAWTQVIANGGKLYKQQMLKNMQSQLLHEGLVSLETQSLIRKGMIDSCRTGGVAWPLFDFKVKNDQLVIDGKNFREVKLGSSSAMMKDLREVTIACKTGTAQHGGEETPPHAWITLFAPAYDPQIVVTVLVESGGQGSSVAGPVAKKVLETWFSK